MDLMLGLTDNKVEQEGSSNFLMDPRREKHNINNFTRFGRNCNTKLL